MTEPDLTFLCAVAGDDGPEQGLLVAENTVPADTALPTAPERVETTHTARERRLIEEAQRDICEAHPGVPAERVIAVVECLWTAYDGARIREFIPVLVRRQAREALRDHLYTETTVTTVTTMWVGEAPTSGGALARPAQRPPGLPGGCA